ncbi:hypothetical protein [Candidatus Regiella endosymbiont of Tuberolachnus salignus]|uniref:hypothetical protein n=1 Tax=Candidatus Regiella endosymbiont of Tuberolachnus salignus TaxID=3077956 RepID=UPI0030D0E0D6
MNFELRQGGQGDRPMSVDRLRDSASTRRQQSRNLKGEGYKSALEAPLGRNAGCGCSPSGYVHAHRSVVLAAEGNFKDEGDNAFE